MKKFSLHLAIFFLSFVSLKATAFPDLVRLGYNNCITCHLSPGGGGAMTQYGRELSKEALSANSSEHENWYFGTYEPSEKFNFAGDARILYRYLNTPAVEDGLWVPMQAELAAYLTSIKDWIFGVSVGPERINASSKETQLGSRIHYALFQASDDWRIRLGKFPITYGLMIPEHFTSIRKNLGFDEGKETYNLEMSFINENWNHFISYSFGRFDRPELVSDSGLGLVSSYGFTEKVKLGLSLYFPESTQFKRIIGGPFLLWGFSETWFLLSEIDVQTKTAKSTNQRQNGVFSYWKMGDEIKKGIVPFVEYELNFTDTSDITTKSQVIGLGVQYFPRPHWQMDLNWQKQSSSSYVGVLTDYAYVLLHYYL